jgi:hypothetical protein
VKVEDAGGIRGVDAKKMRENLPLRFGSSKTIESSGVSARKQAG